MKPEDEEPTEAPTEEERREAAALAAALEGDTSSNTEGTGLPPPPDALETASLLRHARAPLAVPPAHEPIATALATKTLATRRTPPRPRRRVARWLAVSLLVPSAATAVAAAWLLLRPVSEYGAPEPTATTVPAPSAGLLAAQAEATRGGNSTSAALARLDVQMRAYRRQYIDGLRRRGGGAP